MRVVVIGSNGQLGTDVAEKFRVEGEEVCALTHEDLEITIADRTRSLLAHLEPAVIVNTAAMHHVENCEKAPLKAYEVNALGARNVAIAARELGAKLVHVSTDYVFDGSKQQPYVENDPTTPINVYGNTKVAGEAFIRAGTEKYFIVRTSALYGESPCRAKGGRNFVELMLKLAGERKELRVVDDEIVTPTSTKELARQISVLVSSAHYGVYHATAEGSCSWHGFAAKIFEIAGAKVNLKIAQPDEFPAKVPRPKYSVLENRALKALGMNVFRSWEEGLLSYFSSRVSVKAQPASVY